MAKILNLYAGIGGNRKLWTPVGNEHEITAVELNPEIAAIYKEYFPDDTVIVADAHEYLLNHYKEFDFIWASPPCVTHSRMNINFNMVRFPDLKLYEEIIFLKHHFKGLFCVENVIPYYGREGLIITGLPVQQYNRHLFWCNFKIKTTGKGNPEKQINGFNAQSTTKKIKRANKQGYKDEPTRVRITETRLGFNLSEVKLTKKQQVLRNLVDPEIGLMILNCALKKYVDSKNNQLNLKFDE